MKRKVCMILSVVAILLLLYGCSSKSSVKETEPETTTTSNSIKMDIAGVQIEVPNEVNIGGAKFSLSDEKRDELQKKLDENKK